MNGAQVHSFLAKLKIWWSRGWRGEGVESGMGNTASKASTLYSVDKYLLSTYYVSGTVLGSVPY